MSYNFFVSDSDAEGAFENLPGFVVAVVQMEWSDETWRADGTAWVLPLGDDECIAGRAKDVSG